MRHLLARVAVHPPLTSLKSHRARIADEAPPAQDPRELANHETSAEGRASTRGGPLGRPRSFRSNSRSSTTLVTGVTGFTGSRLAEILLGRGVKVRGLVRGDKPVEALEKRGMETIRGDLRDPDAVARAVEGVERIYHVAATYREGGIPEQQYFDINVGGTRNVLDAALRYSVSSIMHTSTVGVHGHIESPPGREDSPFSTGDAYQESKLEAELLARKYQKEKGLPLTVVRPGPIYGPGDLRFRKLFRSIARGHFVMVGSGEPFYHLTYVDDLCEGMILAAHSPTAVGRVYIIAGATPVCTLNELVLRIADVIGVKLPRWRVPFWSVYAASVACEALWKILPGSPPLYPRRVEFFSKSRSFDDSRARTELGYVPKVTLEDGLRRTFEWYRSEGLL